MAWEYSYYNEFCVEVNLFWDIVSMLKSLVTDDDIYYTKL